MPEDFVVKIQDLSYSYPTTPNVLKKINLKIKQAKVFGIIGPNASGKSTLLKTFNGLVPHFYGGDFEGSVIVDGLNTLEHSVAELSTKVGIVFQNPESQLSHATTDVYEEVGFGLSMLGFPREAIKERIAEAIEKTGLGGLEERNPFELSGGQIQRLAIATVLTIKPKILVLDEPIAQLDPIGKSEVLRIVRELTKEKLTIVIVEHALEELAKFADRMAVLHEGIIMMEDETKNVLRSVEKLNEMDLDAPSITQLAFLLKKEYNVAIKEYPITLSQAIDCYKDLLGE